MNIDGAEFIYYILPSLQINALFCYLEKVLCPTELQNKTVNLPVMGRQWPVGRGQEPSFGGQLRPVW